MENNLVRNRVLWIVLIVIFVIIFIIIHCCNKTVEPVNLSKTDSIAAKNDSLELVISKLDSVLKANKIEYETKRDSIVNQSINDDCDFFSKYLSKDHK